MIAAYAIVLHAVLGGIVLAQQATLAHGSTAVICYSNGTTDSGDSNALRHIPCAVCAAVSMATPPEAAVLPLPLESRGAALVPAPDYAPQLVRQFSPKCSQGPPASA